MKVLFLGGTGLISSASTHLALECGIDLYLLNRGTTHKVEIPPGATVLEGDAYDEKRVREVVADHRFDAVVNWVGFTPEQIERHIDWFAGRVGQYIFISSASAYQKPLAHYLVREDTPLANPHWDYSRQKIACEESLTRAYRDDGFPATVVRPSLTYGLSQIPLCVGSWNNPYTIIDRMRRGAKIIVPGDGTSLWTLTHNSDFAKGLVGLLGHQQALGQAFHITSDEVLTWDQIYLEVGRAAGVEPRLVHIPSDFIVAYAPDMQGGLLGDKAISAVFDNSKIKRFVPDFVATTPFARGIRRTLAWFEADERRRSLDGEAEVLWDRIVAAYESALPS
jgi:nucleoside-diphosphate-sugar epimerase